MPTLTFAVGDRVFVTDPALADLRAIMARATGTTPPPNHHGTVMEVADGRVLIDFDGGGCAPYPPQEVRPLTEREPAPAGHSPAPSGPARYHRAQRLADESGQLTGVLVTVESAHGQFHWELADLEATLHLDGLPDELVVPKAGPHADAWVLSAVPAGETGVLVRAQFGPNVCWWVVCPSDASVYPKSRAGMGECATTFCDFDRLHAEAARVAGQLEEL